MRSRENSTGVPVYYCVRPKTLVAATGVRWEMLVYPTPTATENALSVSFDYPFVPAVPVTGEYPAGAM